MVKYSAINIKRGTGGDCMQKEINEIVISKGNIQENDSNDFKPMIHVDIQTGRITWDNRKETYWTVK